MKKRRLTRQEILRYWKGVEFVALNDDAGEKRIKYVKGTVSVGLLADIFGKTQLSVARDVVRFRKWEKT